MTTTTSPIAQALSIIQMETDKSQTAITNANSDREKAIKFHYDLRLFVEQGIRNKVSFETIVNDLLVKLKERTPHGPDNHCDL